MKIINKNYSLDFNLDKRITLISDLHFLSDKDLDRLNCILENIEKQSPNYICITGDILDKSKVFNEDTLIDWLKNLSKIAKVIVSLGNHEFYIDKKQKMFGLNETLIKKIANIDNLYLLDNKNIIIDNINFIGLTVPMNLYYKKSTINDINELLNKLKTSNKCLNILLCHSPEFVSTESVLKDRNIDLILCGHMHGGAVPTFLRKIFGYRGIISPSRKLFPKYAYGKIKINKTSIIITSGTKVLPKNKFNSIFNPEIVNLTFKQN